MKKYPEAYDLLCTALEDAIEQIADKVQYLLLSVHSVTKTESHSSGSS